jgi:4-alpha-glucanotransferase
VSTPVATLLPLTSLKNFQAALNFIAWLKKTGQQGWQMLPVSDPLSFPYRGMGIGLASYFYDNRMPKEQRVYLLSRSDFVEANRVWLDDFALFKALEEHFGTNQWWRWSEAVARYEQTALTLWRKKLRERIEIFTDEQFFLTNQMLHLKQAASQQGIKLIADLPFYVAKESPLVWAHQECFILARDGSLPLQSGVPKNKDEPFNEQFWGHPLYNWQETDNNLMVDIFYQRLKFLAYFYDLVRLDHVNGFFRYGMMSLEHPSWSRKVDGPGGAVLLALLEKISNLGLGVYFEDTASESMRLEQFMKDTKMTGVGVLTLMYNVENNDEKLAMKIPDGRLKMKNLGGNKVVFSSTHDTPPLITWVKSLPPTIKKRVMLLNDCEGGLTDRSFALALRTKLLETKARLIVIPWQDWLLDNFRFNVPGREDLVNWNYKVLIEKYL